MYGSSISAALRHRGSKQTRWNMQERREALSVSPLSHCLYLSPLRGCEFRASINAALRPFHADASASKKQLIAEACKRLIYRMIDKPRMVRPETRLAKKKSKEDSTSQFQGQPSLWSQDQSTPDTGHADKLEATSSEVPVGNAVPREDHALRTREKQTIQDLLLPEGLLGVKVICRGHDAG